MRLVESCGRNTYPSIRHFRENKVYKRLLHYFQAAPFGSARPICSKAGASARERLDGCGPRRRGACRGRESDGEQIV